jgi:predicted AAA+ superfamily ATPase
MTYKREILTNSITYLLQRFPIVALFGPRQCGKSTLLKGLVGAEHVYDLEYLPHLDSVSRNPNFFLENVSDQRTVGIDEAQEYPPLFQALRYHVDRQRQRNGQFLITGSSSPDLLKNVSESLAGRVYILELAGFTLEEAYQLPPSPVFSLLQSECVTELLDLPVRYTPAQLLSKCFFGGFPEPFIMAQTDPTAARLWFEAYLATYINRDIRKLFPNLQFETYRRFVQMIGGASGEQLILARFAEALGVSEPTVRTYLTILEGTFLYRTLPAYLKNVKKQMSKSPRGYLRDSGLMNFFVQNFSPERLLASHYLGAIWEGYVINELVTGFRNRLMPVSAYYYRTKARAEIDLILEGEFGALPIEIKYASTIHERDLRVLQAFIVEHKLPYGLVINNADRVARIAPQIIQLPLRFL